MNKLVLYLAALTLSISVAQDGSAASIREKLVAMENVNLVIPLDATTTYVGPKIGRLSGEIIDEAIDELYGACDALGGSYQLAK
jgi:hypothetical protein